MLFTIMKPNVKPIVDGRRRDIGLWDYVVVHHVDVHGTWEMTDCMSAESRAKLARWANEQERKASNERGNRRHARHG